MSDFLVREAQPYEFDALDDERIAAGLLSGKALTNCGKNRKRKQRHNGEGFECAQKYFAAGGQGTGQGRSIPPKLFCSPSGSLHPARA